MINVAKILDRGFFPIWACGLVPLLLPLLAVSWKRTRAFIQRNGGAFCGQLALVGGYVALIALLIPWHARLVWWDSPGIFTDIIGHSYIPKPIWPEMARYWPLGMQEWNMVRTVMDGERSLYFVRAMEFAIVCIVLFVTAKQISNKYAAIAALTIFCTDAGVTTAYGDVHFSEANTALLLAGFVWAFFKYEQTKQPIYACLAALLTHVGLYYKETNIILFGGVALVSLTINVTKIIRDEGVAHLGRVIAAENLAQALVLAVSLFYLVMLSGTMLTAISGAAPYAQRERAEQTLGECLFRHIYNFRLIFGLGVLVSFAFKRVRAWKNAGLVFSLSLGALLFTIGHGALGLVGYYLQTPVVLISAITVAWLGAGLINSKWQKYAAFVPMALVVFFEPFVAGEPKWLAKNPHDVYAETRFAWPGFATIYEHRIRMDSCWQVFEKLRDIQARDETVQVYFKPTDVTWQDPWIIGNYMFKYLGIRNIYSPYEKKYPGVSPDLAGCYFGISEPKKGQSIVWLDVSKEELAAYLKSNPEVRVTFASRPVLPLWKDKQRRSYLLVRG